MHNGTHGRVSGTQVVAAIVAVGFGAAVLGGGLVLLGGGGAIAALAVYALTGAVALSGAGVLQAARPVRPRLARILARVRRPVALLTH